MLGALAMLAQLAITVNAPDTVALDGMADVRVSVTSRSGRLPVLSPPAFRPFLVVRAASSQRIESGPGGPRIVAEWRWSLAPTRDGTFNLPGFVARAGGETARTPVVRIVVRGGSPASARVPAIVARAGSAGGEAVRFRAIVLPDTVYVGQQATYQLGVFLDPSVRDRVRRMEAVAPEMQGVMSYDPSAPMAVYDARGPDGRRVEAHVYERAIFPLAAGRLTIPAARLSYSLPLSYSFFSREEGYELRSDSIVLVALDPPLAGRPPEYAGAVGRLRLSASLDSAAARVGDPLTLTVRVSGEGNVRLWPRPPLEVAWASIVASDERVRADASGPVVRGVKEFEWLVTPQREGRLVLPGVRYGYWDPAAGRYDVAQTAPETLSVAPGALVSLGADSARAQRLPLRARYRGPLPTPPHERRAFWLVLALVPLPALLIGGGRRVRRRRPRSAPAMLRALSRHEGASAHDVRRTLVTALEERLGVEHGARSGRVALVRAARRAGAPDRLQAALDALLAELEESAYGAGARRDDWGARGWDLYRRLDRDMVPSALLRGKHVVSVLLLALLVAAPLAALQPSGDARDFARAAVSYRRGDFGAAERLFERVGTREPRAADAWANMGTAAWAAGDTAVAALGWQRALRLEPMAADARERLALTGSDANAGAVVPLPPPVLALLAAALWVGAWAWVTVRLARGRRMATMATASLVAAALTVAAGTRAQQRALAGTDLAVAARAEPLRLTPSLAADPTGALRTGEVARVRSRSGAWARVGVDDERSGWVPSASLRPIAP